MLVNSAKLGYKKSGGSAFADLLGFKEIPETDIGPEKVGNICLTDKNKQYEDGIGDAGDITYKLKYDNSEADCPYRVMGAARDAGEVLSFQGTLIDGVTTEFDGRVPVKRTGGGVNGVIEFNFTISLQSDLTVVDLT